MLKLFCDEMGRRMVPDRYVDAFCGRVPGSVLAKRYSDFAPEKLKELYDRARSTVLYWLASKAFRLGRSSSSRKCAQIF